MDKVKFIISKLGVLPVLVVVCILCSIISPYFFQVSNFINILHQVSITAIIGVGMTFVILTGGIDLSVGSIVALSGLTMAVTHKYFSSMDLSGVAAPMLGIFLPICLAIILALIMGTINGTMVAIGKIPAFIMTFGMMNVARGCAYLVSDSNTISVFPDSIRYIGNGKLFDILPIPIVIAVILVLFATWILKYTKFGRYVYALGSNREALRLSGVNIKAVEISVYMISAMSCVIASIILIGKLNVAQPVAGTGYEMDAIAAAIIGGTSINGGKGTVVGTFIGALLVGTIRNGMNLMDVAPSVQPVVIGGAIIASVFYDTIKVHNKKARQT